MSSILIPDSWAVTSLGEVSDFKNGRAFKSSEWAKKGLPIIRIQNVNSPNPNASEFNFYEGDYDESILIQPGDLLFCWSGSLGTSFGPRLWNGPKGLLNQHIFKVTLSRNIERKFYYWQMIANLHLVESRAHGGVGLTHITKSELIKIPFVVAPLEEQKRIVAKIESVYEKIKAIESCILRAEEQIRSYRDAVYTKLLSQYESVPLETYIVEKPRNGYSPRPSEKPTSVKTLTLGATTSGYFNPDKFKFIDEEIPKDSHLWLNDGDILIQRSNSLEHVGVSAIYRGSKNTFIYPDLMMKVRAKENAIPDFLHIALMSPNCRNYFRSKATGAAGNMPKINQGIVLTAPIPKCSLDEQREILQEMQRYSSVSISINQVIEKLRSSIKLLKDSLLSKAFSGRLVSQDPSDGTGVELLESFVRSEDPPNNEKKMAKKFYKKRASK